MCLEFTWRESGTCSYPIGGCLCKVHSMCKPVLGVLCATPVS